MAGLSIAALVAGIAILYFWGKKSAAAAILGVALVIMGAIGTFA